MRFFILPFFALALAACSHQPEKSRFSKDSKSHNFQTELQQALSFMEADQDSVALKALQRLLKSAPDSKMRAVVFYNMGLILEKNKKCSTAQKIYRRALLESPSVDGSVIEAQSLWRLNFVYECLKNPQGMLASLRDLQSRAQFLPREISFVELNARIAMAYKALKNNERAESYWEKARKGLRILNKKITNIKLKKDVFSRTLYNLGTFKTKRLDHKNIFSYLKEQKELQNYFLRSVEFDSRPWSKQSAHKILKEYTVLTAIMKKNKSKKIGKAILRNIESLKSQRFPDKNESKLVTSFFRVLDKQYEHIQGYVQKL